MAFASKESPRKIPGYFFDKEKKRYFKIPPKTDKSICVNIPKKRRESSKRPLPLVQVRKAHQKSSNNLNLLRSHQYGFISAVDFQRKVERVRWEQVPTRVLSLTNYRQLYPDKIEALCLSQNGKYLIRKHVDASSYPNESNFGIYSVSIEKDTRPELNIEKIVHFTSYHTQFSGCDWAVIDGSQCALFAFQRDGPFNSKSSILLAYQLKQLSNLEGDLENGVQIVKKPWVMEESPWSISANNSPCKRCGHFGIGGETRQHMYDVELKMRYSYPTNKITVLSQGFCKQSPYLLSGLRNGKALIWDLRSFPNEPAHVMQNENKRDLSPIIWLQPIINDTFIIVQKQNGELALWDTRTYKKCVVYNHSNSDLSLDLIGHRAFLSESERLLVGFPSGDDKPMFYDVMSGAVLTNKFYDSHSSKLVNENSRFCYGSNWGGGDSCRDGVLESTSTESWRFFPI